MLPQTYKKRFCHIREILDCAEEILASIDWNENRCGVEMRLADVEIAAKYLYGLARLKQHEAEIKLPPDERLTLPYDELDDDGFCDCPECCGE